MQKTIVAMAILLACVSAPGQSIVQGVTPGIDQSINSDAAKAGEAMAASVMKAWPNGVVATTTKPGHWGYEEGVLLDGLTEEWHQTANSDEFSYIKAAVDKYVTKDGTIQIDAAGGPFAADEHQLDDIELGRTIVMLYRVTQDSRYQKAAKFLATQLEAQPRAANGGYWHKTIYPNQMWLDGAYMAEPFRAEYAATFQQPADFDDIAKQFELMYDNMRDPKTGLLRHGWDVSKQMPWADKGSGLSPEVWSRALGWYCVALVDVLDWIPEGNPQRPQLIAILQKLMPAVLKYQDLDTGLWWQVMDKGSQVTATKGPDGKPQYTVDKPAMKGNFLEASASSMFVYATAKGVRMGYLPQGYEAGARKGWAGIQKRFVTVSANGNVTLTGTVKVGGLGGKPYRSGTFEYYVGEPTGDNDAKGVGAYLLAASEMEQAATEMLGQGSTTIRIVKPAAGEKGNITYTDAAGKTSPMNLQVEQKPADTVLLDAHQYKWDDDTGSGFAFFGRAFRSYGVKLAELKSAPGEADLKKAQIYILAASNSTQSVMDKASADVIEAWVKDGGVLLLMADWKTDQQLQSFNSLSDRFGIHFNAAAQDSATKVKIPTGTDVFKQAHTTSVAAVSTIAVSSPAQAVVIAGGAAVMAVAELGKGSVLAVGSPWLDNESVDHGLRVSLEDDTYAAAKDVVRWTIEQAK